MFAVSWSVVSRRKRGFPRRQQLLLVPQPCPVAVGNWLEEYRQQHGHSAFQDIFVVEHIAGIEPVVGADPHSFVELYRQACRAAQTQDMVAWAQWQQSSSS